MHDGRRRELRDELRIRLHNELLDEPARIRLHDRLQQALSIGLYLIVHGECLFVGFDRWVRLRVGISGLPCVVRRLLRRPLHDALRFRPDDGGVYGQVQRRMHRLLHGDGQYDVSADLPGKQLRPMPDRGGEHVHDAVHDYRGSHRLRRSIRERQRRWAVRHRAQRPSHDADQRECHCRGYVVVPGQRVRRPRSGGLEGEVLRVAQRQSGRNTLGNRRGDDGAYRTRAAPSLGR